MIIEQLLQFFSGMMVARYEGVREGSRDPLEGIEIPAVRQTEYNPPHMQNMHPLSTWCSGEIGGLMPGREQAQGGGVRMWEGKE